MKFYDTKLDGGLFVLLLVLGITLLTFNIDTNLDELFGWVIGWQFVYLKIQRGSDEFLKTIGFHFTS